MTRRRRAHVSTDDLEQALDYLEGLIVILDDFAESNRGRDSSDELAVKLENMDSQGGNWRRLRYQVGAGAGWRVIADEVAELRRSLLSSYTDAAL